MTRFFGTKRKTAPRPITWIKVGRSAPYVRFVIPACFVCGNETDDIVMYRCDSGGVRGLSRREPQNKHFLWEQRRHTEPV